MNANAHPKTGYNMNSYDQINPIQILFAKITHTLTTPLNTLTGRIHYIYKALTAISHTLPTAKLYTNVTANENIATTRKYKYPILYPPTPHLFVTLPYYLFIYPITYLFI